MSKPKKPNPSHGPVQPFNPPILSDKLIEDLISYLGITIKDKPKHRAIVDIETQLGMYQAEAISLDHKPSFASIKAEVTPIFNQVNKLYDMLDDLTPSSLSEVYGRNMGSLEDGNPINNALLYLAKFNEMLKPIIVDKTIESRGGSNKQEARRILILSLAKTFNTYAKNQLDENLLDFIFEIIENQQIPDVDERFIRKILKPD